MTEGPRLRPREHGAYAMLAFPATSGLVLGGASWAGAAFIGMALAGFLAHESVLVVLGGRGARVQASLEGPARARLVRLAAFVAVGALVFAATAPGGAWAPAVASGALVSGVGSLLATGHTRTLAGELLVAAAFASVHGVVAATGGAGPAATWLPVAVWAASFGLATLSVHALKYRFKGRGSGAWAVVAAPAVGAGLLVLCGAALASGHPLGHASSALAPKAAVAVALAAVAVHPRHLRRVGWTLVAADAFTLLVLATALG